MRWTKWLSASLPLGLLVMAGCGDKDPVSSAPEEEILPAGKLVISNRAGGGRSAEYGFPKEIVLPAGWRPEGIEIGRGTDFYVGSMRNGNIFKGDLRTGAGEVLVTGSGTSVFGVCYEEGGNRLFVAGGRSSATYIATGNVYDADTGALLASYPFANSKFINDVAVTQDAAYFTDSLLPVLYVVPFGPGGALPASSAVKELALSGDYQFLTVTPSGNGLNNNGIVATPDGKQLIVINMGAGILYRVDPKTGVCRAIQLDGVLATNGDGLHLEGMDLYVVQNRNSQIVQIRMAPDFETGMIMRTISSPRLDIPTTIAVFGNSLYAVNARATTPPELTTLYTVVRLPR